MDNQDSNNGLNINNLTGNLDINSNMGNNPLNGQMPLNQVNDVNMQPNIGEPTVNNDINNNGNVLGNINNDIPLNPISNNIGQMDNVSPLGIENNNVNQPFNQNIPNIMDFNSFNGIDTSTNEQIPINQGMNFNGITQMNEPINNSTNGNENINLSNQIGQDIPISPIANNINMGQTVDMSNNVNSNQLISDYQSIGSLNNNIPVIEGVLNSQTDTLDSQVNNQASNSADNMQGVNNDNSLNSEQNSNNPTIDNFNMVPTPPVFSENDSDKKTKGDKKKNNKTLIILLVIILIGGIGYGVYYILNNSNSPVSNVSLIPNQDMRLELGSVLSKNPSDYAKITGYDSKNCTVDTSNIDINSVSRYNFTVSCNGKIVEGSAFVDDTKAPVVSLSDVMTTANSKIKPEDFIESCTDASECQYKFVNEEEVLANMQNNGEYEVKIIISDSYDNEIIKTAKLIINNSAPSSYFTCVGNEKEIEEIFAISKSSYKFGIDSSSEFSNAVKTTIFTFETKEDYENAKSTAESDNTINGLKGNISYDDQKMSITVKENRTLEELNTEFKTNFPTDSSTLKAFLMFYNYTCE